MNQHNQGGQDKKLIRHRINEFSEISDKIPFPGNTAVKKISQASDNKQYCCYDPTGVGMKMKQRHNGRYAQYAGDT